ncbi:MAG: response regulator [Candidatus Saganbacteria bacterium]|nr:response regulator [Candidatus Saganbacteria bacterium]
MKARILVVDDERDILFLLRDRLVGHGYAVEVAMDVLQAKALLEAKKIDLIVLDIMLPGIDGYEFCRELKNNPQTKQIPVIMLTVRGFSEDKKKGYAVGANAYLTKPFSGEKVLETVEKLLQERVQ